MSSLAAFAATTAFVSVSMMPQTAHAASTDADSTVPKGHHADSIPNLIESDPLQYLQSRHQKTILVQKAHDTSDTPVVWGPFNVHVYSNDEVGKDIGICGSHLAAQCKSGKVCVRLQPVGTNKWLSHGQHGSTMTTKEEEEGRVLGCSVVIETEVSNGGGFGAHIVDFEFIDWWTGDYDQIESHIGMEFEQPVTEDGYAVRGNFMWTFVDIPDPTEVPTEEPTAVPTPVPTAMTVVPAPENETETLTPTTTDSKSKSSSGLSTGAVVGIAVGGVVVVLALIALATVMTAKRRNRSGTKVSRTGTVTEAHASEQLLTIVTAEEQQGQQQVVEAEPVAVAEEEENVDEL